MGCSSSAPRARRPPDPPPPRASSGENTPAADEYETISDQTKLEPVEGVSLASEGTRAGEHLPGEEPLLIPALEETIDPVTQREEPEGTEPLPAGSEERAALLPSAWQEESTGPSPPEPGEDPAAPAPAPAPAENRELVEGDDSSAVEIVKKAHAAEGEQLIEGETGEQVETELLCEIVSEGPETKEEETGEAVDGAAAAAEMGGRGYQWYCQNLEKEEQAVQTPPSLPPANINTDVEDQIFSPLC